MRENMRYHADIFLAALRTHALQAGRYLTDAGLLGAVDDVFYLTRAELRGALAHLAPGAARFEDLAKRGVDRRFGQPRLAAERLEDLLQTGAERFEHDSSDSPARAGRRTFG